MITGISMNNIAYRGTIKTPEGETRTDITEDWGNLQAIACMGDYNLDNKKGHHTPDLRQGVMKTLFYRDPVRNEEMRYVISYEASAKPDPEDLIMVRDETLQGKTVKKYTVRRKELEGDPVFQDAIDQINDLTPVQQ